MKGPKTAQSTPFLIARAILGSSGSRRTAMGAFLVLSALLLFLGLVPMADWIEESLWRFLIFWAGTLVVVFMTFGFALLEVLYTIRRHREELAELRKEMPDLGGEEE